MATLHTKILSIPDEGMATISSIILRDTNFEITAHAYKGGKTTSVSYVDVKQVHRSPGNTLIVKIKRTEVVLGKFDDDSLNAIIVAISVGQTGEQVSHSKAWKKYISDSEKEQRRAERRRKIADTISGMKDGISEALRNSPEEMAEAKREEEKELQEEKAKKERIDKIRGVIESLRISLSDPEEDANHKLNELGKLCHSIIYSEDKYDDVSSEALAVFQKGIEIVNSKFPNSPVLKLSESRIQKLKVQEKKNKSDTGCYIAIGIFMLVLLAWWWLENN